MDEVFQDVNEEKKLEIDDVKKEVVDEYWPENDKQELIEEYTEENNQYKKMIELVTSGYVPPLDFETYSIKACYLFGYIRHNHPEYEK